MEIKKNESAILFEKNERMRLENAVTSATNQLLDVEERYVFIIINHVLEAAILRHEIICINSTFNQEINKN